MSQISQHRFNQGLLLAARAAGAPSEFLTEGPKWNAAFGVVAEYLKTSPLTPWARYIQRDPVFSRWPEADELVVQGEHDLILGFLTPGFTRAVFLMKPEQAALELEEFPNREWFQSVGQIFAEALQ